MDARKFACGITYLPRNKGVIHFENDFVWSLRSYFNTKTIFPCIKIPFYKDKMVIGPLYFKSVNFFIVKMTSLYWTPEVHKADLVAAWECPYWTRNTSQIASFMGPTWGQSGADRTQVGPKLAPWTLLSGFRWSKFRSTASSRQLYRLIFLMHRCVCKSLSSLKFWFDMN